MVKYLDFVIFWFWTDFVKFEVLMSLIVTSTAVVEFCKIRRRTEESAPSAFRESK
jgi:hypothetical protein